MKKKHKSGFFFLTFLFAVCETLAHFTSLNYLKETMFEV